MLLSLDEIPVSMSENLKIQYPGVRDHLVYKVSQCMADCVLKYFMPVVYGIVDGFGRKLLVVAVLTCVLLQPVFSQTVVPDARRTVGILDVSERLKEVTKNVNSIEHICKTIGVPYSTSKLVSDAVRFPLLIICSDVTGYFNAGEIALLKSYVSNGGVLVAPYVSDPNCLSMFGISSCKTVDNHHTMTWTATDEPALRWIDDPLEKTMSLGSFGYAAVMYSCSYLLTTAVPLATYSEDGTIGMARNAYGKGFAYSLGFSFQAVVFVSQVDNDFEAQRTFSGGFEPTADVLMLFVKGLYAKHIQYATWKHSLPYNNLPLMLLSHDVDSEIAMADMNDFAAWEWANGIHSTYFITTHYFSDSQDRDYYTPNIPLMNAVSKKGFELASHTVGHFPDILKFPFGLMGNTKKNYNPAYANSVTTGGSLLGEAEVSKVVLEDDNKITVNTFRAGYNYYPNEIGRALDTIYYRQSSINTANDVLTNFPYYLAKTRSKLSDMTKVLEIPVCLYVDVTEKMNKDSVINLANQVMSKVYANYAPFSIASHPTTLYKLSFEKDLIKSLSSKTVYMTYSEFGSYWRRREAFTFTESIKNDSLIITIPDAAYPVDEQLSLVINNGQNLKSLVVKWQNGQAIGFMKANLEQNDLIVYFKDKVNVPTSILRPQEARPVLLTYPNPFSSQITIAFNLDEASNVRLEIFDLWGRLVDVPLSKQMMAVGAHQVVYTPANPVNGVYLCRLVTDKAVIVNKIVRLGN